MKLMRLDDIKIKDSFENSTPKSEKMDKCRQFWNTYHKQDRWIVVNNRHTLIDGYIQYLILKENNIEEAEVHFSNKRKRKWERKGKTYKELETIYVYGVHLNSKSTKERVWRVPKFLWNSLGDSLNIGDMILVKTKYGLAPIKITRIERLSKCPVDIPVKKVVRKINIDKIGGFDE